MLTGFKEDFYYFPYGSVYVYTMNTCSYVYIMFTLYLIGWYFIVTC